MRGKKLNPILLLSFIFLLLAGTVHAHLPMSTEYAETLPKDGWEARFHVGYMDMGSGDDNWMTEQMYELKIGYGLTRDLSVYIQPSYKVREMEMPMEGMSPMKEESSGIGDTDAYMRYRFLKEDREDGTFQTALLLGIKVPTGEYELEDNGRRLMPMVQPGTGSVDYQAGLAMTYRKGKLTVDQDLIYRVNTENQDNYKFGNLLSYDLAGLYQMKDLYLMLELNGRFYEMNENNGVEDVNTGGHQIFINPGVSYHIMPNLMLMASVQVPIYTNMNGSAQETNYHAMGGVHWFY